MTDRRYPLRLAPVSAPFPAGLAENAARALGPDAKAAPGLVASGRVPADVLAGMTLFLLAGQARGSKGGPKRGDAGVAGGVWVREHFTVHRPVRLGEEIVVTGAIQRAYSRGGRRYSVTTSETRDARGALLVSNCTTGLVRYRREPGLADGGEGLAEDAIHRPAPDARAATGNPSADVLRALRAGDAVASPATCVSLEMMRARDGGESRNPIHTDPAAAREAGLVMPIAGGSHVFSFLQEALMCAFGDEALLHGACLDLRWTSQVRAGSQVEPRATVVAVSGDRVDVELEVACEGRVAMKGSLAIPLPGS